MIIANILLDPTYSNVLWCFLKALQTNPKITGTHQLKRADYKKSTKQIEASDLLSQTC